MRLSRGPEKRRGLHKMQRQFKRRRVFPFDLSKALFILPNAFTVSSICCGVYAILQCAAPEEGAIAFYRAALAIFFAGFFDMFDGRVARMTRTQSDFGVQMDSLADVISFGVAPAILVYTWALEPLGTGGKMIAFLYVSCGTIRLARFNVLAARGASSSRYFIGLPIPVAAAMLVSLVIAQYKSFGVPVQARNEILVLMVVLSYLMVSNVRYLVLVFAALLAITLFFRFSITLVTTIGFYIFYGLLAEVLFYSKRKQNDLAEKAKSAAQEVSPNEA